MTAQLQMLLRMEPKVGQDVLQWIDERLGHNS